MERHFIRAPELAYLEVVVAKPDGEVTNVIGGPIPLLNRCLIPLPEHQRVRHLNLALLGGIDQIDS
jgi:hypothetical protein